MKKTNSELGDCFGSKNEVEKKGRPPPTPSNNPRLAEINNWNLFTFYATRFTEARASVVRWTAHSTLTFWEHKSNLEARVTSTRLPRLGLCWTLAVIYKDTHFLDDICGKIHFAIWFGCRRLYPPWAGLFPKSNKVSFLWYKKDTT